MKNKEKVFVAMNMPNLAFRKGIILEADTDIEESLDNKELYQTGWQKINGTKVITHINIDVDYDSSKEKGEDGKPLTTKAKAIVGKETRVIDSTVEYPIGTKLIWTDDLGYMRALDRVSTPDEIIEKINVVKETFKEIGKE